MAITESSEGTIILEQTEPQQNQIKQNHIEKACWILLRLYPSTENITIVYTNPRQVYEIRDLLPRKMYFNVVITFILIFSLKYQPNILKFYF